MTAVDYVVNLVLSGILIVGAYQFYFFTQRHPLRSAREFLSPLDEKIPFIPWWSWIYSFLYYPAILYLNWVVTDSRQFTMLAFSFLMLLFMQMLFLAVSRLHTRTLAQHQYRPLGFGKIPAVRAEIRPVQQLFSQHARVGGNAHGDARTVAFGHGGICVSCADCAVVPVYQAALSDRPARRSGTGLGRLQPVRLADCVIAGCDIHAAAPDMACG